MNKTKKTVEEFQHFRLKHEKTGQVVEICIGPMPIHAMELEQLVKAAYREKGIVYKDAWNIEKAWVGPKNSQPPKMPKTAGAQ